jgi:hypothetical protein
MRMTFGNSEHQQSFAPAANPQVKLTPQRGHCLTPASAWGLDSIVSPGNLNRRTRVAE